MKLDFMSPRLAGKLADASLRMGIEEQLVSLGERGIDVLAPGDARYPKLIREIGDPPPVLFSRGAAPLKCTDRPIAVVGARRPTAYGLAMTRRLVSGLAGYGFTIVSGLAAGIDAAAHRAAIEMGAKTVAFLGCGVERSYPLSNHRLMEEIILKGAVYSEYLPEALPFQQNFPQRNRLISGASLGVVVVEAGERSGSLITAGFAGEQGRDVFAVPGNATSPLSKGANALLRDGAIFATSAEDIVFALNGYMEAGEGAALASVAGAPPGASWAMGTLGAAELSVASLLKERGPQDIDAIAEQCRMTAGEAGALAILLEIKGLLRRMEDGMYEFVD
ncbi:MAG: DNA-processing protein DprA [Oscillospiraceae bacterium]|nr:DNA-processing protein DprA [Oscillospiraceae bacterium]